MSREIKFRAWLKHSSKMFEWDIVYNWHFSTLDWTAYNFMQYTGLKDKNGKEIYEGDIVEYSFYTSDTEQEHGKAQVIFERGSFYVDEWFLSMNDVTIVIGNIYENHELISPDK